jgi:hypothetical protein
MDLPRDPDPLSSPPPPPEPVTQNYPPAEPYGQQPYIQPPPYEPPQKARGGFNWLTCCGIGCGVALLVGIIAGFFFWKSMGGFVGDAVALAKVSSEVQSADLLQVSATAEAVTADQLVAATDSYKDKWVNFTGTVSDEPDSTRAGNPGSQSGTGYYVEPNIFVLDVSNTPAIAPSGSTIQAVGKVAILDLSKIGPLKEELENDPDSGFKGQTKMIFVITKQVTLVQGAAELTDLPSDAEDGAEGEGETGAAEGDPAAEGDAAPEDSGAEEAPEGGAAAEGGGSEGWGQ